MTIEDILTELYNTTDGTKWDDAIHKIELYANQQTVKVLVEIKNDCSNTPAATFADAYAHMCLKIVDKIKELKE